MATFKELLLTRFPTREQILPVLSLLLFITFSWSLYRMFNFVPSWLGDFKLFNVLVICAYVIVFALIESLIMLGFFLVLSAILPTKYFRKEFAAQGSLLAVILGVCAFLLQRKMKIIYSLDLQQLISYPLVILAVIFLLIFLTAFILRKLPDITRIINSLADRFTIFLYIYIPLGLVSIAYIIFHRLFLR